jgi:hypothetical protein
MTNIIRLASGSCGHIPAAILEIWWLTVGVPIEVLDFRGRLWVLLEKEWIGYQWQFLEVCLLRDPVRFERILGIFPGSPIRCSSKTNRFHEFLLVELMGKYLGLV